MGSALGSMTKTWEIPGAPAGLRSKTHGGAPVVVSCEGN